MITLITGGIKSGKSDFALSLAERKRNPSNAEKLQEKEKFYFLATALPIDNEIKKRIEKHKKRRKSFWKTIEEPVNIERVINKLPPQSVILLDCLTLWLGNILVTEKSKMVAFKKIKKIITTVNEKKIDIFFITNEVGCGIIPNNKMSRVYGDVLARLNQIVAECSDEVYLMVAGISVKVKERKNGKTKRMFKKNQVG